MLAQLRDVVGSEDVDLGAQILQVLLHETLPGGLVARRWMTLRRDAYERLRRLNQRPGMVINPGVDGLIHDSVLFAAIDSKRELSAVDDHARPRHEGSVIGGKKGEDAGHILGRPGAPQGDEAADVVGDKGRVVDRR